MALFLFISLIRFTLVRLAYSRIFLRPLLTIHHIRQQLKYEYLSVSTFQWTAAISRLAIIKEMRFFTGMRLLILITKYIFTFPLFLLYFFHFFAGRFWVYTVFYYLPISLLKNFIINCPRINNAYLTHIRWRINVFIYKNNNN